MMSMRELYLQHEHLEVVPRIPLPVTDNAMVMAISTRRTKSAKAKPASSMRSTTYNMS